MRPVVGKRPVGMRPVGMWLRGQLERGGRIGLHERSTDGARSAHRSGVTLVRMKVGLYRRRHVGLCMSGHVCMPTKRRRARRQLYRGGELALAVLAQRGMAMGP